MSSIGSINEPEGVREKTLTPQSPNEPTTLPEWATEAPVVTSLEPTECTLGDANFTIAVSGTGFYEQSTIVFAGHDEPTTLESDGTLTTGVNMAVWQGPDTVQVGVRNGPIESNTLPFTFKAAKEPPPEEGEAGAMTTEDGTDPDELEGQDRAVAGRGRLPAAASRAGGSQDLAEKEGLIMAIAVVTKASGGLPVIDVTATKPGLGVPVTEATNGRGIAVTKVGVAIGGLPVTYVAATIQAASNGSGIDRSGAGEVAREASTADPGAERLPAPERDQRHHGADRTG